MAKRKPRALRVEAGNTHAYELTRYTRCQACSSSSVTWIQTRDIAKPRAEERERRQTHLSRVVCRRARQASRGRRAVTRSPRTGKPEATCSALSARSARPSCSAEDPSPTPRRLAWVDGLNHFSAYSDLFDGVVPASVFHDYEFDGRRGMSGLDGESVGNASETLVFLMGHRNRIATVRFRALTDELDECGRRADSLNPLIHLAEEHLILSRPNLALLCQVPIPAHDLSFLSLC